MEHMERQKGSIFGKDEIYFQNSIYQKIEINRYCKPYIFGIFKKSILIDKINTN